LSSSVLLILSCDAPAFSRSLLSFSQFRYRIFAKPGSAVVLDTCTGSDFDTRLSYSTTDNCVTCLGTYDDQCAAGSSFGIVPAPQGMWYNVLVSGFLAKDTGSFALRARCAGEQVMIVCVVYPGSAFDLSLSFPRPLFSLTPRLQTRQHSLGPFGCTVCRTTASAPRFPR
jgi:hypothetical protein